jgi:hypothetical protein
VIFGNPLALREFENRRPLLVPAMETVHTLVRSIYGRRIEDMPPSRQVVFLLARHALEDYAEIGLLCGYGYGHGGHKLLRGMFERVVTVFYLSAHPDEVRAYMDYDGVAQRRQMNTVLAHLPAAAPDPGVRDAIEARYREVKDQFMITRCRECKAKQVNFRWHKLDTVAMAAQVGLGAFIVPAYTWSTNQIHDTVRALNSRVRVGEDKNTISFDSRLQPEVADNVLCTAHGLLLNVLTKVVELFEFTDVQQLLDRCHADYAAIWPVSPQPDADRACGSADL